MAEITRQQAGRHREEGQIVQPHWMWMNMNRRSSGVGAHDCQSGPVRRRRRVAANPWISCVPWSHINKVIALEHKRRSVRFLISVYQDEAH